VSMTEAEVQSATRQLHDSFESAADFAERLRAAGIRDETINQLIKGREAFATIVGGSTEDPFASVYMPDVANDHAAQMQQHFASGQVESVHVIVNCPDNTTERIALTAEQGKKYFEGAMDYRRKIETRQVLEVRLSRAVEAASAAKTDGDGFVMLESMRPAAEVSLSEFGALEYVESNMPRMREGWLREASANLSRLRESPWDALDDDAYGWGDRFRGESLQYQTGAQQMFLADIWDEQAKCAYAFSHDPVAKQCIKIIVGFVLGRAVMVKAKDKRIQAVIDEFCGRIRFQRRLKRWATSAGRDGELFLRVFPLGNGRTGVRMLEARSIWEVVTLAEDVNYPLTYVQRYMTRFQLYAPADQQLRYVSREYPANEVIHVKLNTTDSEARGRSDMFAELVWHKLLRDYWLAAVLKEESLAAYQIMLMVDGDANDTAAVASVVERRGKPKAGEALVMNKKVTASVIQPTGSNSAGQGSTFEGLLNMIAMGYGFSKLYLGADGARSRAGSTVQAEPSEKAMQERQDEVGEMIDDLLRKVVSNAIAGGLLVGVKDEDLFNWKVQFPRIIEADVTQFITNLQIGRAAGYVSALTAAGAWANEMDLDEYDYAFELGQIKTEAEEGIMLPPAPQGTGGSAFYQGDPEPEDGEGPLAGLMKPGGTKLALPGANTGTHPALPTPKKPPTMTIPNPNSNDGKAAIRQTDRQSLEAAMALVTAAGGIVILEQ
jgi:hypothetical protein